MKEKLQPLVIAYALPYLPFFLIFFAGIHVLVGMAYYVINRERKQKTRRAN